jgi:HEAT repeat protein
LHRGKLDQALAAYDRGPPDPVALQRIAEGTLERELQSRDASRRAQAMAALEVAGTPATRLLRLAAVHASDVAIRARALGLLARFGDRIARAELRDDLATADPDLKVAAVEALDPEADAPLLRLLCETPSLALRLSAVQKLARAPANADNALLFARVARLDPALPVRIAALYALGRQGPAVADAIETRLDDAERGLRLAAVSALVQADYPRAALRLERYLADNPTPEGIEAARALLSANAAHAPAAARTQLEHALAHHDNALRAAAAVVLMSLRDPSFAALAVEHAQSEAVRSVRLCLALSLGASQPAGRSALTQLANAQDVVSAQAAAELARSGDRAALQKLMELRTSRAPAVRRAVARALASELGHAHDARAALLDADPSVRIAAAGAILGAAVRQKT